MKDEKSRIVKIMSMWACTVPLVFACLILILSGVVKMGVSDFAVDSQGRIYMKALNEIEIYESQEKVGSINVNPLRGYQFTILEDVVWVSDGGTAYTLDLNSCEDPAILADIMLWECVESTPELEKRVFVQDGTRFEINGDTYERHNALFWSSIKKNGEVTVYQISAFSFIVKQFLCFYFILTVSLSHSLSVSRPFAFIFGTIGLPINYSRFMPQDGRRGNITGFQKASRGREEKE